MRKDQFPTTQWSLVLIAGEGFSEQSQDALATLCRAYWYPLYAFVRRQGHSPEEAQDLTQGFFTRLLERRYLSDYERERGRFRTFLLTSLKHFLSNERDWARAQKRGSGVTPFSLDDLIHDGERRFSIEPRSNITPERIFEKQWALTVLDHVLSRLQTEFVESGREDEFKSLKPFLTGDELQIPYRALAAQSNTTEGALKVAIHRVRRRFRDLLREEISHTVSHPDEVQEEIRCLIRALGM